MSLLTPENVSKYIVIPTLEFMEGAVDIPASDEAHVMVMAIAGQESNWQYRLQQGGPARSLWQFEKGGGVAGVLSHPASSGKIKEICELLGIACDQNTVYEAMAWNSFLGCAMARLLLYTDAAALPKVGDVNGGWNYYLRNWRPGAPHPEVWPDRYKTAMETQDA